MSPTLLSYSMKGNIGFSAIRLSWLPAVSDSIYPRPVTSSLSLIISFHLTQPQTQKEEEHEEQDEDYGNIFEDDGDSNALEGSNREDELIYRACEVELLMSTK